MSIKLRVKCISDKFVGRIFLSSQIVINI